MIIDNDYCSINNKNIIKLISKKFLSSYFTDELFLLYDIMDDHVK